MIRPKRYLITLPERELQLGDRTLIMGVLNVTPDSFSDGGKYNDVDRAVERALELEAEGADIIDIGAESTRPGAEPVSEAEELRRLIPVLKKLKGKLSIPISVDTTKAAVAARALENGAEFINDASTLTFDTELAKVVGDANAGLILNHMRGTPATWQKLPSMAYPMKNVLEDLDAGINRARRAGIDRSRIIVDPGLGFGKRGEQNYELIARLGDMASLDLPILVGPSRKSFLGQQELIDADRATAAAVTVAVLHGAHIVRVHDVAAIRAVLQTADGILRSISDAPPVEKKAKKTATPNPRDGEGFEEAKPIRPPGVMKKSFPPGVKPFDERPVYKKPSFDEEGERPPRRTYDRDREGGDRPPYRKPYGEQREGGDRPPYRKPFGDKREGGDRPPYRKPYGEPREGGDRPPYRKPYGEKREGGDRPPYRKPYGEKREGGDRPPYRKPFGEKREGGDRPPYKKPFGEKQEGGDRPPYKKPFSGGSKPPFKKKDDGGFKPKRSPVRSPRPRRDD